MRRRLATSALVAVSACTGVVGLAGCNTPVNLEVTATGSNSQAINDGKVEVIGEGFTQSFDSSGKVSVDTLRFHGWKGIKISATGYETIFRQIDFVPGHTASLSVQMRPAPQAHHVMLSETAPTPVAEGIATVTIQPGGLVKKDGSTVTGEVDVQIIPYDPVSREAPPASMLTIDGRRLMSLGMSTITIKQDGEELQPKPGMPLEWAMDVNPALIPMADPNNYRLFSVNEKIGIWQPEPSATLAYDASTLRFTAKLPHLSVWNLDWAWDAGACITGHVYDAHHHAVTSGMSVSAQDVSVGHSVDSSTAAFTTSSPVGGISSPQYLGALFLSAADACAGADDGCSVPPGYYYQGDTTPYPINVPGDAYFIPVPGLDAAFDNGYYSASKLRSLYGLDELPIQIQLNNATLPDQALYAVTKNGSPLPTATTQGPFTPPAWQCDTVDFQFCLNDGASCSSGDQCCNGQACNGDGKCGASTCHNTGSSCSTASDCCNGQSCVNGVCGVLAQCSQPGGSCHNVTDCCNSPYCLHNVCTSCLPANATGCSSNSDCCDGSCINAVCQSCHDDGASCSVDAECCNGGSCKNGTCSHCADDGSSCSSNGDCCGGSCLNGTCMACVPDENACVNGGSCCGAAVCAYDNKCRVCTAQGGHCTTGHDCCSGQCSDNFCL